METYQVRVVNSDFESSNHVEAANFGEARRHALRAVLDIGADEVCNGKTFFGAEVIVERDGEVEERFLVGIGQSPLKG